MFTVHIILIYCTFYGSCKCILDTGCKSWPGYNIIDIDTLGKHHDENHEKGSRVWFIFVNSSHHNRWPDMKFRGFPSQSTTVVVWGQLQWLKNSQLWISQLRGSLGQPAFPKTGSQFWSKIWRSQNGFCHAHLYVYIIDIYVYVYIQYYHIHTHTVFRMHMKSYLNQYASWIILSLCVCTVPV